MKDKCRFIIIIIIIIIIISGYINKTIGNFKIINS